MQMLGNMLLYDILKIYSERKSTAKVDCIESVSSHVSFYQISLSMPKSMYTVGDPLLISDIDMKIF